MSHKTISAFLITLVLLMTATSSHATLVGYWNFNEGAGTTAGDSSGNGNNGTLAAGTQAPTWITRPGGGSALNFDRTQNQFLTVLSAPTLNIGGAGLSDAISFTAWVKYPNAGPYGGDVLSKGIAPLSNENYDFFVNDAIGEISYRNSSNSGFADVFGSAGGVITGTHTGAWTHFAVVLQENGAGTTNVQVYANGALLTSTNSPTSQNFAQNVVDNLLIGAAGRFSGGNSFSGAMDDVTLWNEAISPTFIASLAAGAPVPEPTATAALAFAASLAMARRNRAVKN